MATQAEINKAQRARKKQQKRLQATRRRNERKSREKANVTHRTYQSPRETEERGYMKQHIVNQVLGMFGGR